MKFTVSLLPAATLPFLPSRARPALLSGHACCRGKQKVRRAAQAAADSEGTRRREDKLGREFPEREWRWGKEGREHSRLLPPTRPRIA